MRSAVLTTAVASLLLTGACTVATPVRTPDAPPAPPKVACPPLPELPERVTPAQQAAYFTLIVRMYAQCAESQR